MACRWPSNWRRRRARFFRRRKYGSACLTGLQLLEADVPGAIPGAPARHQTLRAAIDWSYELLDEAEQRLLRRLMVFEAAAHQKRREPYVTMAQPLMFCMVLPALVHKSLCDNRKPSRGFGCWKSFAIMA
jgi:hypothetical protein